MKQIKRMFLEDESPARDEKIQQPQPGHVTGMYSTDQRSFYVDVSKDEKLSLHLTSLVERVFLSNFKIRTHNFQKNLFYLLQLKLFNFSIFALIFWPCIKNGLIRKTV